MSQPPTGETKPAGSPNPELTVVVVGGNARARLEGCLRSVLAQEHGGALEVVVVDCAEETTVAPSPPGVRWIRPEGSLHYGEALALGARSATAPIVAFLEEHARALPGWARSLCEALQPESPWAAAACEVHSANPGLGLSDGWGLMGYGMWYAPLAPGETKFLHGYNSACRRDVLLSYGEDLSRLLLADTAFAERLRLDGHRMVNAPGARIEHLNEVELLLPLRKTLLAHRFSAPTRAQMCRWSRWRRLAYVVGSPLLPVWGLWCQARRYRGRPEQRLLARILPHFVIAHAAMATGLAIGLALGPGDSAATFTRLELNNRRPEG